MEIPIGCIFPYFGSINTVQNDLYKVCNGTPIEKSDLPLLYNHLVTVDPSLRVDNDTCNLPNLTGTFIRGVDEAANIDEEKRKVGSIQLASTQMPNAKFFVEKDGQHTHTIATDITAAGSFPKPNVSALKGLNAHQGFNTPNAEGSHSHQIKGGDKETRPRNMALNFIIRAK